jgi:protein-tyrosine phosphatase
MFKRLFSRPDAARLRVLMVCTGNLCRSPMAEVVLRGKLQRAGLGTVVAVDSAGTHGFKRGTPVDARALAQAGRRGYDLKGRKSRPLVDEDFTRFDLLLAMDHKNLDTLHDRCPATEHHRVATLLSFLPQAPVDEIPDPYYGSPAAFDLALDLIEPACDGVLAALRKRLAAPA